MRDKQAPEGLVLFRRKSRCLEAARHGRQEDGKQSEHSWRGPGWLLAARWTHPAPGLGDNPAGAELRVAPAPRASSLQASPCAPGARCKADAHREGARGAAPAPSSALGGCSQAGDGAEGGRRLGKRRSRRPRVRSDPIRMPPQKVGAWRG